MLTFCDAAREEEDQGSGRTVRLNNEADRPEITPLPRILTRE